MAVELRVPKSPKAEEPEQRCSAKKDGVRCVLAPGHASRHYGHSPGLKISRVWE